MLATASATRSQTCSLAYAEEALARMKGCHVHIEGVDECVIAFLMTLAPAAVRDLVGEWHHDLGFPTVSRLMALEDSLDQRHARRNAYRARSAA
jgi:hypothetical protein